MGNSAFEKNPQWKSIKVSMDTATFLVLKGLVERHHAASYSEMIRRALWALEERTAPKKPTGGAPR